MTTGMDVYILQNLLSSNGGASSLPATGNYGNETSAAVLAFQKAHSGLPATGSLDAATAAAVLELLSWDRYVDDGASPASLGYAYKVHIQVHANRSVEPTAHLIAGNGTTLFSFVTRLHGADGYPPGPWPTWNSTGPGLNQFSDSGATPTGLCELDLNTPEDNSTEFGPYPINRAVTGIKGNWRWIATNDARTMVRDGILLHTGMWNITGWAPPEPMPNSLGCIHAWPQSIYTVWQILTKELGVTARPNTDGQLPYPYKPQGLLSVEQVDPGRGTEWEEEDRERRERVWEALSSLRFDGGA
jgi:hypothetical protein